MCVRRHDLGASKEPQRYVRQRLHGRASLDRTSILRQVHIRVCAKLNTFELGRWGSNGSQGVALPSAIA